MLSNYVINLILLFFLTPTDCIDVLRFDDPKDIPSTSLKIGNISDDSYEVFLDIPNNIPFPVGQDLTICYRWFFDQARFTDPGGITLHLKLYKDEADIEGTDELLYVNSRIVPNMYQEKGFQLSIKLANFQGNMFGYPYLKWKDKLWYNNLMADTQMGLMSLRPQLWRNFCLMVDWNKRLLSLVVNGEKLYSEPMINSLPFYLDEKKDWPRAELIKITYGPKLNAIGVGKSIGIFTDLNVFSRNIGDEKAMDITG